IPGSGKDNRVTKTDILNFVKNREVHQHVPITKEIPKPVVSAALTDEIIEMTRMRKVIAERMVASKRTAPHVTSFVEVDMTEVVEWRNKVKSSFRQKNGEKITFTPILIQAIVRAIQKFPMIN
ncbi:MAG: 2-oxo acid dehydrogenase subunit E2, partial [Spirosomaceae bacterium]|nr:2-oxo acid dehydrogenase subunit E2 [Spirosomataceae bacterium]